MLYADEVKREKDFYKKRGLPYPKAQAILNMEKEGVRSFGLNHNNHNSSSNLIESNCLNGDSNHLMGKEDRSDCHRSDEQINILIENRAGSSLKSMKRKFIRCSANTTVRHLKKFVAKKLFNNFDRYNEVSPSSRRLPVLTPVSPCAFRSTSCARVVLWPSTTRLSSSS